MENYNTDYLAHHGTKGMKWGIRRYQNPDGSLTDAGRKRYGDDGDPSKSKKSFGEKRAAKKKAKEAEAKKQSRLEAMRKGREEKQKRAEEEAKQQAATEAKKKAVLESRSAKTLYENANLFTNDELHAAYQRLTLERNIAQLAPKEISRGEQFVNNTIKAGQKVNDIANVGINLYNNMAKLHNSLTDEGKQNPWPLIKDNDKKKNDGKKKDKDNNQNQNQNQNSGKKDKGSKDKGNKDKGDKTKDSNNNQEQNKTESSGNKSEKTESKTETYTGTVEGKGTSTSKMKSGSDWVNDTNWDDVPYAYYRESTAIVPARRQATENWVAGYLEDYSR